MTENERTDEPEPENEPAEDELADVVDLRRTRAEREADLLQDDDGSGVVE